MSLATPGRVDRTNSLQSSGGVAGVAASAALPWATVTSDALLQDQTTTAATTTEVLSWDRTRLEKELFIHMTGKWFVAPQAVTFEWTGPTASLTWDAASVQLKVGESHTFLGSLVRTLGNAVAKSGSITLQSGTGNNVSTAAASTQVGGSNTTWYQQDRRRFTSANFSTTSITNGSNDTTTNYGGVSSGGTSATTTIVNTVVTASTTLGTTVTSTPVVNVTVTFLYTGTNEAIYTDNLGGTTTLYRDLSFNQQNFTLTPTALPPVTVSNYMPYFEWDGSQWVENTSGTRITSLTLNRVALTWGANTKSASYKVWLPAQGYDATVTSLTNGKVMGAVGQLTVVVKVFGAWETANGVTYSVGTEPTGNYTSVTGVTLGPFSATLRQNDVKIGWGEYTP